MHLEEFARGPSLLHRLDPRVKIPAALALSMVTAVADRWVVLAAALILSVGLTLGARLPFSRVAARLLAVNLFLAAIWLFLPFSTPGRPLAALGPFTATWEGAGLALAVTLKSNAIVLGVLALLATSPVFSLVHGLRHLRVPDKLVHLFFFTFRYFQVIHEEYLRLRLAMRVRCFVPKTDRRTYRALAWLVGMLLVRSYDRSIRVHQAMRCRGYDGRLWILHHFELENRDLWFLAASGCMILVLAGLEWTNLIL
jgi:cobalt/nickel transport system permease protein